MRFRFDGLVESKGQSFSTALSSVQCDRDTGTIIRQHALEVIHRAVQRSPACERGGLIAVDRFSESQQVLV